MILFNKGLLELIRSKFEFSSLHVEQCSNKFYDIINGLIDICVLKILNVINAFQHGLVWALLRFLNRDKNVALNGKSTIILLTIWLVM